MAIAAVNFRIVVQDEEVKETSEGGIILARDERLEKERAAKAKVVSIGPTAFKAYRTIEEGKEVNGHCPLKAGDVIHYSPHTGLKVVDEEDGQVYRIITDDDVMALVYKRG